MGMEYCTWHHIFILSIYERGSNASFFCATTFVSAYDIFNYEGLILSDLLMCRYARDFSPCFFMKFFILWLTLKKGDEPAMDKHLFTFQDLMAFGMFMIALLTFIFSFIR